MTLAIAGMTLAAMAAVGYPLVARRGQEGVEEEPGEAEALQERKDSLYGDIRDLEMDRRTGKVAETDYEAMRAGYEIEAARVLERLETGAKGDGHSPPCGACGMHAPTGARFCPGCGQPLALTCPSCGAPSRPEHRFCGVCGHELPALEVDQGGAS